MMTIRAAMLSIIVGGCAAAGPAVHPAGTSALSAPEARLQIHDGELVGRVKGGFYDVRIRPEGAKGTGSFGAIDVRIVRKGAAYSIEGTWNGGPVSFDVRPGAIRGTAMRHVSSSERGFENCWFDVEKQWRRPAYSGREDCLGSVTPLRFELLPHGAADVTDQEAAILVIAYLLAPPVTI
jgi:hypothetical protein